MNAFLARVRLLHASSQRVFAVEVGVDKALREVQVGRESVVFPMRHVFVTCLILFQRLVDTQHLQGWLLHIPAQRLLIQVIAVSLCGRFNRDFTEVCDAHVVTLLLHLFVHLSHIRVNLAVVCPYFKQLIYVVLDVVLLQNANLQESPEQGLME